MKTKVDHATEALRDVLENHADHIHSNCFQDVVKCLELVCNHIKPEHRWLVKSSLQSLQDITYQATVNDRQGD